MDKSKNTLLISLIVIAIIISLGSILYTTKTSTTGYAVANCASQKINQEILLETIPLYPQRISFIVPKDTLYNNANIINFKAEVRGGSEGQVAEYYINGNKCTILENQVYDLVDMKSCIPYLKNGINEISRSIKNAYNTYPYPYKLVVEMTVNNC